jgi:hypothetical protein
MFRRSIIPLVALWCFAVFAVACGDDPIEGAGEADTGGGGEDDTGGAEDTGLADGGDDTGGEADESEEDPEPDAPSLGSCTEGECGEGATCRGGGCVDAIESPEDYVEDAAGDPASYWWSMQFPALYPEAEACCFDYNGDNVPDDGLGTLVGLLGSFGAGDTDIQGAIDDTIAGGSLSLVNHWVEFPDGDGDARLSAFLGRPVLDTDGEPVSDFDARVEGEGQYDLDPESFDDFGALVQFNNALIEDGVLYAGPSTFRLTIPIEALGDDPIQLVLEDARFQADISVESDGIHTVDVEKGTEGEEYLVCGGKLGGVVNAAVILDFLDEQFRACSCAGVDPDEPIILHEIDTEQQVLAVSCTDNTGTSGDACGDDDGPLCSNIGTVCSVIPALGRILDVDLDNDGIKESLSAALRFCWTGAEIVGLMSDE